MLDTVERFLAHRPEITLVEPYPGRLLSLLRSGDEDQVRIINKKVQQVPSELFSSLESGDLVFIDSSHVVKCGSDLQHFLFDILPVLPSGIFVHFHDVLYPFEYPPAWLKQGRYWNESYFLRAFLSYNSEWNIYFFNDYVASLFGDFLKDKMPLCLKSPGSSLYIQRARPRRLPSRDQRADCDRHCCRDAETGRRGDTVTREHGEGEGCTNSGLPLHARSMPPGSSADD